MKRALIAILVALGVSGLASLASAAVHLNWADEFHGARVYCSTEEAGCTFVHAWQGETDGTTHITWDKVGAQGNSAAGAANAIEKFSFEFRDKGAGDQDVTTTLSRWRVTSGPTTEGGSCVGVGLTFSYLGASSYTADSSGYPDGDDYHSNRMRPYMNFSSEAGATGYRAYTSRVFVSTQTGTGQQYGCFKIYWF